MEPPTASGNETEYQIKQKDSLNIRLPEALYITLTKMRGYFFLIIGTNFALPRATIIAGIRIS